MAAESGVDGEERPVVEASAAIPVARWVMAAALISLNFLDVVTTKLIIRAGGAEVNPVMRSMIHDPFAAYALKLSIAVGVGLLLLKSPRDSKLADRAVLAAVGCYMLVIGWNTGLLISAARAGAVF